MEDLCERFKKVLPASSTHLQLGLNHLEPNMDPRKFKRIISNRASAKKSRLKKLQYVAEMENKVKALEAEIAILHPQVVMYRKHQHLLQMEHKRLTQEISKCTSIALLKNEIEENKLEVNRLRRFHLIQEEEMKPISSSKKLRLVQCTSKDMDLFNSNQDEIVEEAFGNVLKGEDKCETKLDAKPWWHGSNTH